MNYTKLLKLLYLADRASLLDTGVSITGDEIVNMANGPVLSAVYDCIKGNRFEGTAWMKFFRKDGYDVRLEGDPGVSELSDYDIDVLTSLADEYRLASYGDMINVAHQLKEWSRPEDGGADWLPYEAILRANGVSEDDVRAFQARNEAINAFDGAVSSRRS